MVKLVFYILARDQIDKKITSLSIVGEKLNKHNLSSSATQSQIRPTIVCGLKICCNVSNSKRGKTSTIETLNDRNNTSHLNMMEVDESPPIKCPENQAMCCLYLVIYDFSYSKERPKVKKESDVPKIDLHENECEKNVAQQLNKWNQKFSEMNENECIFEISDEDFVMKPLNEFFINEYQSFIPGKSPEIFIPPVTPSKKNLGPRIVSMEMQSETDSAQSTSLIIPQELTFANLPINNTNSTSSEKSLISHHISELKNSKTSKLNYSRAVQCVSLPDLYKTRSDLEVSHILPTQSGSHVLVVLVSSSAILNNVLLLYSLDFSDDMVKLHEQPVLARELNYFEKPVEVNLLNNLERTLDNSPNDNINEMAIFVYIDGSVQVIDLATLKTLSVAKLEKEKFVSATYCNSK